MFYQTSNVREFLARALPWPQEGEQPTYVNVHYGVKIVDKATNEPVLRGGKQLVTFPGKACRSVEEAARTIDWAMSTMQSDVYVCMSAADKAEAKTSRKGNTYLEAVRLRDHAARFKSLFIDVDVKPNDLTTGYSDTEEAAREFTRIRTELGLPRPTFFIRSGSGGFHAHWCFAEPITVERWQKLSYAFCAGVKAKGFRGDTQCIIDLVRLLRPPGTFNWKGGEAKPVTMLGAAGSDYFVDVLEDALKDYVGVLALPTAKPKLTALGAPSAVLAAKMAAEPTSAGNLEAGLELSAPTIEDVAAGCPFIARTLASGGAGNNNPLWLQTTNIALFCQDSLDVTHELSLGHPTYTELETDELYERQLNTKTTRNLGWPRCATIAGYGAPECQSCPNFSKNQSPLNFTIKPVAVTAVVTPAGVAPSSLFPLPQGYVYDSAGLVCVTETDENGVQTYIPICQFTIEKPWLQLEPPALNFTTVTHAGHERQIRVSYELIADKSGLAKGLAKQGMLVKLNHIPALGNFFVAFIDKMRADLKNIVQSQPFGWSIKDGKVEGFVYGSHLWSKGIPRPASNPDTVLASQYSPAGALDPWLEASQMICKQKRPAIDAILAASFGAPLVRFTGQTGLLMSTWSVQSGIGKSTVLKVAQAVWGHPQKAVQSLSDTQNAVLKKLGDTKNLPLFWDELKTDEDTERFMNLAFQLSQGKEKSRLASDTSYRDPGTWQTLLCSTSNNSILNFILDHTKTTTAGLFRVFEFEVPPAVTGQIDPTQAQLITAALNDNYGHAGLVFAQFLGEHHERVSKEVAALARALEKRFQIQADERFWLALITVVMSGARYANELKLTTIDEGGLAKFLVQVFSDMRMRRTVTAVDVTKSVNVLTVLARFLNEHRRQYTVLTNIIHRSSLKPPVWQPTAVQTPGTVTTKTSEQAIRAVQIQIGEQDQWCRISKAAFDHWLGKQGIAPSIICNQLEREFGVKEIRGRMCAGTSFVTAKEPLLEFNYNDPVFQDIIET